MLRILYVEDNPEALRPVQRIAALEGYELITTETIAAALSLLHTYMPTLILVDSLLPDGDGTDFTKWARAQGFTGPIINITGYAIQGEQEACFAAGCTEFLVKPVGMSAYIELFKRYDSDGVQ